MSRTIRLRSWNVNGLRACAKKTFMDWFLADDPDILCLQETKAMPEQLDEPLRNLGDRKAFFFSAEKPGYSGVAIYCKPDLIVNYTEGLSHPAFDREGRTQTLETPEFFLVNAYFPNGQRDHARVPFKLEFCEAFTEHLLRLRASGKPVIACGDFNTAHRPIDLRNPSSNKDTTGFLPIERAWMDSFIGHGFVDIFRSRHPEPHQYTWWSYRPGVRARNIGWRIDYFFVTPDLVPLVQNSALQMEVEGSDHCPVTLDIDLSP